MSLSTLTFAQSKYIVFPFAFAFAGVPLFLSRFMPGFIPKNITRQLHAFLGNGRSKEDEERERAEQEERVKKLEEKLKVSAEENRKLKTENTELTSLLQKTKEDSAGFKQSLWREREQKSSTEQSLRREQEEKAKVDSANQRLTTETSTLKRQLDSKEIELKNIKNELQHAQTKHEELTTLLDARTRELKGAQAFLTKADSLSGADVISLVEALNSEILQTSAFISDSFDFARLAEHSEEMKEASTRTSELMGTTMTELLSTVQHGDDPLLVQIALQGAIVEFSRWIIMTWDFDGLQAEQPLSEIYSDIRETETQAVGGRWRALTRAHAQKVAVLEGDLHSTMVTHISDTLVIIMVAAGCTKNYEDTYREFTQKFGERISNIVRMATRLNKAMGEEVTSADLWPVHATAGEKFDESIMEDFEGQEAVQTGNVVLCTTALGLQRSEKVTKSDNSEFEFKNTTLMKPKVALESLAEGLEREGS